MKVAALLATALLAGCSLLSLGYGQGPTLAYWWLDRHADFDAAQAPRVQAELEGWFTRHRREHLADDIALLDRIAREAEAPLRAGQVCGWWAEVRERRDRYLSEIAPAVGEVAATFSPAQWRHIRQRFDRSNQEWRERQLDPDLRQRERAAVERVVERAEAFYGRLDASQRQFVEAWLRRSPWDPQRWLEEREADQRDTLDTLRQLARPGAPAADRHALAREWLARVVQPASEAMRVHRDRLLADQCAFVAELHGQATPGQRRKAVETIRGWADGLRGMVVAGPAAPTDPIWSAQPGEPVTVRLARAP